MTERIRCHDNIAIIFLALIVLSGILYTFCRTPPTDVLLTASPPTCPVCFAPALIQIQGFDTFVGFLLVIEIFAGLIAVLIAPIMRYNDQFLLGTRANPCGIHSLVPGNQEWRRPFC